MRVIVIGGGVMGLSAAWWLSRRRGVSVRVLERFGLDHDRGSSHGASRISRTTYIEARYVRMMQVALAESWPRLAAELGVQLHHPAPGCFFGPHDGLIARYAAAVAEVGAPVSPLTPAQAREVFPAVRFRDDDVVLSDATASVVAARRTMEALWAYLPTRGVSLEPHTPVTGLDTHQGLVRIHTASGRVLEADRVIVTAGAWTGQLIPELAPSLSVTRQTVGYFKLASPQQGRLPHFPVWIHLGQRFEEVHYGLPEFGAPGIKAAHHLTTGPGDDPDGEAPDPAEALSALRRFMDAHFTVPIVGLHRSERCFYTCTEDEGFIWESLPERPQIIVGAGHSGHGFKLAPLAGQVLAELAVDGGTALPRPAQRLG